MPRLRLEIRDFAELVGNLANLRRPLLSHQYTYRKWFVRIHLEVTLHALEKVRAAGPIVIETEMNADATRLLINAWIPQLHVSSRYTVSGGGILNSTRSLEVEIDGGFMGDIQLAEPGSGADAHQAVQFHLQGLRFKFHVFPAWLEYRLQRLIERALENALARLIGDALVAKGSRLGTAVQAAAVTEPARDFPPTHLDQPVPRQGWLAHLAYRSSYCLAYGLVFPILLVASSVSAENAVVEGHLYRKR